MYNVKISGCGKTTVVNYTKERQPFLNHISIEPLLSCNIYGEFYISHLLGRIQFTAVDLLTDSIDKCSRQELQNYDWLMNNNDTDSEEPTESNSNYSDGDDNNNQTRKRTKTTNDY
jgi:hypothetical protein